MVVYEGMFILDPNKFSRDPAAAARQVDDLITANGGTVLAARLWDERKLAYPINGHKKGVYWLTYFRLPGGNVATLERQATLNELVIRKLILRIDPRLADVLVQHALAGDPGARRTSGPAPAAT